MSEKRFKTGRPTKYSSKLASEICSAVACSSKGIKQLCKDNPMWPSHDTIYRWLAMEKEFSDLYARAKRLQIEIIMDEILEIADDASSDSITNKDGRPTVDHEHINRSRLRIDTRKWLAAKLCPRLYGDKDEHVNLKFPDDIKEGASLMKMSSEIFRALANQEISPEQARTLVSTIKDHGENIAMRDLDERIIKLEKNILT